MKNLIEYNEFIQTLENKAIGGLFFHHIDQQIYVTDYSHKLLAIWDITRGQSVSWKNQ